MTKIFFGAALSALALAIPAAAPAQRLSPAVIAVVDVERVARECNACRTANTQLQQQVTQLQQRANTLRGPLQTEGQAVETAIRALNGKQPDAALQQRIQGIQTRQNTANQELARSEQTLRSTDAHVKQQIGQRLRPILTALLQSRNASIVLDKGSTLAAAASVDVTNDVLAQLNQQLTTISVTPLPQQAQQPTGR